MSFGLACMTICIAMTAYLFGLIPDGYKTELDARAKVAEALAVQLAGSINRNDTVAIEETLTSVVGRNADVLSAAFRDGDGKIVLSKGDHEGVWIKPEGGNSNPTHVSVPLLGAEGPQGQIEITFGPPSGGKRIFEIPVSLLVFLLFLAVAGFIVYSVFLRRTLDELDPGRVIPERVQKAFDTLSEGVIILDERERVLLANSAFEAMYGSAGGLETGTRINSLPWRMVDGRAKAGGYPWHSAIKEGLEKREEQLSLRTASGQVLNLNVNATVFTGDKNETIGAIVTFANMTDNKQSADQLAKAVSLLEETQREVERQKQELNQLSNRDALTGCMNRRAFFGQFEPELAEAKFGAQPTTVLMLDVHGLAGIKASFGPAVSDALIRCAADSARSGLTNNAPVGRYGSEGFCVALVGIDQDQAVEIANLIKATFSDRTADIASGANAVTLCVGIANDRSDDCSATELVRRSAQALTAAMQKGPGAISNWADAAAHIEPVADKARAINGGDAPNRRSDDQQALADRQSQRIESCKEQTQFLENATRSIVRAQDEEKSLAILQLGIASWDYFEEALGEDLSQLLLRFAKRQVDIALREQDRVTLLEETGQMLIELPDVEASDDVSWIVKRILDRFNEPIEVGQKTVYLSCRVGAALYPQDGQDTLTLSRNAAIAMRRAQLDDTLEELRFYSADMVQTSSRTLEIETGIREALQANQFELVFQPIVNATDTSLTAAETLLRCTSERLRGVRIDQIIDIAERSSLIADIDMWVVNNSIHQMQLWDQAGVHLAKLSVNLSANQITKPDFMDMVVERIASCHFSPSRIQIEVTETAKMGGLEVAAQQLKRLQDMGVHIALDDFGTGQASLTYVQRLHPDVIKIDRSFIDGLNKNHANATMVAAVTAMAHSLGITIVAEGVETEAELEFLRHISCDYIQGYFISKPIPADAMRDWIMTKSAGIALPVAVSELRVGQQAA
ncbi:putative eal/ggdef/pas/pac-domain-containing signaling protein [Ahrensia sp. R2A130]|nr:putative eal/ggdef/pas/pac-domain-containing signaling protein [Ahrensia sp. R2A130]